MVPLIFAVLSSVACLFMVYALVHFRREYLKMRDLYIGKAQLAAETLRVIRVRHDVRETLPALKFEPVARREVVTRKEVLTGLFIGTVGLLAPFLFAFLLHSPRH
jgi:hypothetical protein